MLEDKKLQKDLRNAERVARARPRTRCASRRRSSGGSTFGRLLLIAFIGAVLAIVLSEDLRKTLLDKLFGAEEEFEYTSTTASAPAAETPTT